MPATRPIDLRSDTVTQPTPAMRDAMARADVGDDVYGEDPTINLLEAQAASRLGKAAALFVPSGSMANLVAVMTHCVAGEEVLLGDQAHIGRIEASSMARVAGVLLTLLPNDPQGGIDPGQVRAAVRPQDLHQPRTRLLALENTHNFCGGTVLSLERTDALAAAAHESGLRTHLDGARIFNAEIVIGVPVADLAANMDTVCFCLSKGLSAPVGSLLCGSEAFMARARRVRKMLGGAMRQAGVLAAAGLVALDTMVDRLRDDHANAQRLATGLEQQGLAVYAAAVETNIVMLAVPDAPSWARRLAAEGVLITVLGPRRARMVTHADVTASQIDIALERIATVRPVPA